ncbi:hypothetical protein LTR85_012168 [Meristemomyces frigidus]|nr:hypothetical protein LTR85_012168 [Meristemomyces frigidus]
MHNGDSTTVGRNGAGLSGGQRSRICLARAIYARADIYLLDDPLAAVDSRVHAYLTEHILGPHGILREKTRLIVTNSQSAIALADRVWEVSRGCVRRLDDVPNELLNDEEPRAGLVPLSVYMRWFRIAGVWRFALIIMFITLGYYSNVVAASMLRRVADGSNGDSIRHATAMYAAAGAVQVVMTSTFLLVGWYLCMKPTSFRIHQLLTFGVFGSPLKFFHETPAGEILNRFTNDLVRQDGPLFSAIFNLFSTVLRVTTSLVVLVVASPVAITAIVPLAALCWQLLRQCIGGLVETRRIETGSRTPLITNLQESMAGSELIRIFGRQRDFANKNSAAVTVLQGCAAEILKLAGAPPSTTGFVLSYTLQVSAALSSMVAVTTQAACEMISVQRIFVLADVEPEEKPGDCERARTIPAAWPTSGKITMTEVSASYEGGQMLVLEDISLEFLPGTSTAIVGRTGAGKSSLVSTLSRLLRPTRGRIEIDGIDIAEVSCTVLRSRIAVIPQNCRAFAWSVRENLDPQAQFDESDLLRAVKDSSVAEQFPSAQDALQYSITQGGANLAVGQLQLLAIARCLLKDCNVLIMDEPTAGMDDGSEKMVYDVLRAQFRNKTMITVSHNLRSAMESDRVVVLDKGKVMEVGAPKDLITQGGLFSVMVAASNVANECLLA